jgi:hypothetical protein
VYSPLVETDFQTTPFILRITYWQIECMIFSPRNPQPPTQRLLTGIRLLVSSVFS